jgi:hypothetical protein
MDYNTDWQGIASSASAARPAHESIVLNRNERRIAWDGEAYALEEFAEFYGFTSGLAIWQQSECQDSAEQPVGITASHSQDENSAAQPVGITTSHSQDEDSAEQPGGSTALQWLASSPEQCVGTTAGHSEDSSEQSVGTTAGHPQGGLSHYANRGERRIANKSLGKQEAMVLDALDRATHDMQATIGQEEMQQMRDRRIEERNSQRTDHERQLALKTNLYYWRRFKEQLSHRAAHRFKQEVWKMAKTLHLLGVLVGRLMRREREKAVAAFLQGLIDPFFHESGVPRLVLFALPDDWPEREHICCPVCVIQYVAVRDRSRVPQKFPARQSRPSSIADHIHSFHTDGGPRRACIVCEHGRGPRRHNERGCLVHQLVKHFSYHQHVANDLARVICTPAKDTSAEDCITSDGMAPVEEIDSTRVYSST